MMRVGLKGAMEACGRGKGRREESASDAALDGAIVDVVSSSRERWEKVDEVGVDFLASELYRRRPGRLSPSTTPP